MNTLRRQIFPALVVLQLCLIPVYVAVIARSLHAADRDPMERAEAIWGTSAEISTDQVGDGPVVYRVGCHLPTKSSDPDFIIAGQGSTWDEAFQKLDYSRNGPHTFVMNGAKQLVLQCQSNGTKP